jgi:hypothetical protein
MADAMNPPEPDDSRKQIAEKELLHRAANQASACRHPARLVTSGELSLLTGPGMSSLTCLRNTIRAIVPDAERCTSHGIDVYGQDVGHYRSGRQRPDAIA